VPGRRTIRTALNTTIIGLALWSLAVVVLLQYVPFSA